jgi:ferritin-like metal-binding protein YciE
MEPLEQIIVWLKDAHAMEQSLESVLQRHIADAQDLPAIRERLKDHLEETRGHAARVRDCLAKLGEQPSAIKSTAGSVFGMMQGMSSAVFADELVKNALADHAMEHFEIACYVSLLAAAEDAGLEDVANAAREILAEEEAMAEWLRAQIPQLTRLHLDSLVVRAMD